MAYSFSLRAPFLHPQTTGRVQQKSAFEGLGEFISEDNFFPQSTEKQTEFWLDLRGTAVHPKAAIDHLLEQLRDDDGKSSSNNNESKLIDRVLLSDQSFQKLVSNSDPYLETSEVLYVPDDDGDLLALSRNGVSFPYGNLVSIPGETAVAVKDPMQAMQTLSEGKWVVLFNEWQGDDMKATGEFLDIASTATCGDWGSTELEAGLLLRTASEEEKPATGGVAVVCSTKSSVVQLASILRCMQSGMSTSVTESGIILQGSSDASSSPLSTALILPFDLMLWKTAYSLVYGKDEQNSDDE
jgi:hypothetical protein